MNSHQRRKARRKALQNEFNQKQRENSWRILEEKIKIHEEMRKSGENIMNPQIRLQKQREKEASMPPKVMIQNPLKRWVFKIAAKKTAKRLSYVLAGYLASEGAAIWMKKLGIGIDLDQFKAQSTVVLTTLIYFALNWVKMKTNWSLL